MNRENDQNNQPIYLTNDQMNGIRFFGLRLEQVQTQNFGEHILEGIQDLINQGRAANNLMAFNLISGLNEDQVRGVVDYGLTRAQVSTPGFGEHTLEGIRIQRQQNTNLTSQEAFQNIEGLNTSQTEGVVAYSLSREQVLTENFGHHTLVAIDYLRNTNEELSNGDAFEMIRGFNNQQTIGMRQYGLTRDHVVDSSFGEHTLAGMQELAAISAERGNNNFTMENAFEVLRGLDVSQTRGVIEFRLQREQVLQAPFGEALLNTMRSLQKYNPELNGNQLYDFVIQMPDYQVRAINEFDFTPEQLGISLENNEVVQLSSGQNEFASGATLDATSYLMSAEGMRREEAYNTALELSSMQTLGMIDFGLSLEQVQSTFFLETEGVLDRLLETIQDDENEKFDIPLWPEDQEKARAIMTSLMLEWNSSVAAYDVQESIVEEEQEITPLIEMEIPSEVPSLEASVDVDEFLRYAYSRDFLGIFDGLNQAIVLGETQISGQNISTNTGENERNVATSYATSVAAKQNQEADSISSEDQLPYDYLRAFTSPIVSKQEGPGSLKNEDDSSYASSESAKKKSSNKQNSNKKNKGPRI